MIEAAHHGLTVSAAYTYTGLTIAVLTLLGLVYRVARRIENAIGKDEEGRTLNQRVDRIEHQVWPNGGTSLADSVHRVERGLIEQQAEQRVVRNLLTGLFEAKGNKSDWAKPD